MRRMILTVATLAAFGAGAAGAQGKPPLSQVSEIDDPLLMIAIADQVRKRCESIDARMFKAWTTINALESKAKGLGYSDEEIEDYVTSDEEKARMRRRGEALMRQRGLDPERDSAYCTLGREEIARGSQIGVLLRER
ncbi:DUF5333 domain-containing protein [Roseivivax sp.]